MSGLARLFFAASAVVLRTLAWAPMRSAEHLLAASRWCERQARPRDGPP